MVGNIRMLICDTEGREIDPRKIFGKKVHIVEKAMAHILKYGLGDETRYEDCYRAPKALYEKYKESCVDGAISFTEWKEKYYPEECELERLSCFAQDQKIKKSFKLVYGAARKNGYFLEWQGKVNGKDGNPDWWTVSQHKCVIGHVQLISS